MAGTSQDEPGHDAEETTCAFNASLPPPRHHLLIRCLQSLANARPRIPAPLHVQNGLPPDSNNHEFSADVSVWRDFVRRSMGSRLGEDFLGQRSRGIQCDRRRHRDMKLSYRWVIVAIGALMTCVGIGAMFSLAVYLEPMSANT